MTKEKPTWIAGPVFRKAMEMAVEKHADHARKVDNEPYLGHLLAVASNVIEAGGTEVQAAAALLHDAIEDQGCTQEEISVRVSPAVASIVAACSENRTGKDDDGPETWAIRKNHYLMHLAGASADDPSLLVALADKVNNCEKSARDFHRHVAHDGGTPGTFWKSFNSGDSCQEWWYRGLLEGFKGKPQLNTRFSRPLLDRLQHAVDQLFDGRAIVTCDKPHQHWQDLK